MKKRFMALLLTVVLAATALVGCGGAPASSDGATVKKGEPLTFVIVPKGVHAWFDEVNKGAQEQAKILSEQLGVDVKIDYRAPSSADVAEQNSVLEQAAATKPTGIALDPTDYEGNKAVIEEIESQGIPVILFDAPAPEGSNLTSVGNDFAEQARLAAEKLVNLIGKKGKVAVMQGVPSAPNHAERYKAYVDYLKKFPDIEIIDGGISNDSIEEAQTQAAAVIAANPDLKGYLMADAAAPIGISSAIKEAGKKGQIKVVGLENLIDILKLVKEGTIDSTTCTVPRVQGSMSVMMLWQKALGAKIPKVVDTGIDIVTQDNVEDWIKMME
jgi:ribose transport system substrate-binding protein